GPRAAEIFEPVPATDIRRAIRASLPHLLTETAGDERNVILTLARMWFTAVTGEIVPKDTAATWAAKQVPAEHAALMHYARAGYLGQIQDRWEENRDDFKALVSCMKQLIEASLGACWRENL